MKDLPTLKKMRFVKQFQSLKLKPRSPSITTPGTMALDKKYPECKDETSQTDWMNCVKAIQEKEGRKR
jgi:hypothetical protein